MDEAEFWAGVERPLVRYGATLVPAVVERARGSYVYDTTGRAIRVGSPPSASPSACA
jgi:2,2-dialkylglycine decarboxylase (pyruvate)